LLDYFKKHSIRHSWGLEVCVQISITFLSAQHHAKRAAWSFQNSIRVANGCILSKSFLNINNCTLILCSLVERKYFILICLLHGTCKLRCVTIRPLTVILAKIVPVCSFTDHYCADEHNVDVRESFTILPINFSCLFLLSALQMQCLQLGFILESYRLQITKFSNISEPESHPWQQKLHSYCFYTLPYKSISFTASYENSGIHQSKLQA